MVSTSKKRQSNRSLLSQLDDFDQDVIIGNTVSDRQEKSAVNECTGDQDFIVCTSDNNSITNENTVKVKTLERCFNGRIDWEMNNFVDTVEDRIQNAILTAIDSTVAPKREKLFPSNPWVTSGEQRMSVMWAIAMKEIDTQEHHPRSTHESLPV